MSLPQLAKHLHENPSDAFEILDFVACGSTRSQQVPTEAGGAAALCHQPPSKPASAEGLRLREERLRLGYWTQAAFARVTQFSQACISKIELGEAMPSGALLAAAAVAGLDVRYVLIGERTPACQSPEDVARLVQFRLGGEPLTIDRVGEAVVATLRLLAERRA